MYSVYNYRDDSFICFLRLSSAELEDYEAAAQGPEGLIRWRDLIALIAEPKTTPCFVNTVRPNTIVYIER